MPIVGTQNHDNMAREGGEAPAKVDDKVEHCAARHYFA
jgi:hypothetical protein